MINVNLLKGSIIAKGLTIDKVATKMGIDTATMYRKINGNSDFYLHEIIDICQLLDTNNPMPIFFDGQLTKTQEIKTRKEN